MREQTDFQKGNKLKKQGKLEEAILAYRRATEINPGFSWTYHELGEALNQAGRLEEAIEAYKKALQLQPNSAWFHRSLGKALGNFGNLDEAIFFYCKTIKIDSHKVHQNQLFRLMDRLIDHEMHKQPNKMVNPSITASELFSQLGGSKILESLIPVAESLLFVGDKETLEYINNFFLKQNRKNDEYLEWKGKYQFVNSFLKMFFLNSERKLEVKTIIVSSIREEDNIYEIISCYIRRLELDILLVKLFGDVFISSQLKNNPLQVYSNLKNTNKGDKRLGQIQPKLTYVIVSTPRSGSTALCSALASTKLAGLPQEDLYRYSELLSKHCNFNYLKYLAVLMTSEKRTTSNGVFGTKLISHFLRSHLRNPEEAAQLKNMFDYFIYLTRRDKIAQAVSVFLANRTNYWHIRDNQSKDQYNKTLENLQLSDSDFEQIYSIYSNFIIPEEKKLLKFFEDSSVTPFLKIYYEDFDENKDRTTNLVLRKLGIIDDSAQVEVQIETRKLSDKATQKIIEICKEKYRGKIEGLT